MPVYATLQSRMPGTTANTAQRGHSLAREAFLSTRADAHPEVMSDLQARLLFSHPALTFQHLKLQLFPSHRS